MIIGLIPSRLNSRRLKHKPLLEIDGLPIIVHTFKRAQLSKKLDKVIVCADDMKIVNTVRKHGGDALLTSKKHKNGTERIAEVAKSVKADLFIDVHSDEAILNPKNVEKLDIIPNVPSFLLTNSHPKDSQVSSNNITS